MDQVEARCRSCGAPIRWVMTAAGRMMPIDLEPNPKGNVVLTGNWAPTRGGGTAPVVAVLGVGAGLDPSTERFKSHFATCPLASKWRKK